jgi:hypothetical protein
MVQKCLGYENDAHLVTYENPSLTVISGKSI